MRNVINAGVFVFLFLDKNLPTNLLGKKYDQKGKMHIFPQIGKRMHIFSLINLHLWKLQKSQKGGKYL